MDVPGVGGGRDIPYKRYTIDRLHDLGGEAWFKTDNGRELGVSLFRVQWTLNNYEGTFARPSFVIYLKEKLEDGESKEHGYAFAAPDVERLGVNLKWALAYCYMAPNEKVRPLFTKEPFVNR